MPAHLLSTPTTISTPATPPIRLSRDRYSEGDRLSIRQSGVTVSLPVANIAQFIEAVEKLQAV